MTLKQHVHELLAVSTSPEDNPHSRTVDLAILSLIFLNILALVLDRSKSLGFSIADVVAGKCLLTSQKYKVDIFFVDQR